MPATLLLLVIHSVVFIWKIKVYIEAFGLEIVDFKWLIIALPIELFFVIMYDVLKNRLEEPTTDELIEQEYKALVSRISKDVMRKIKKDS